MKVRFTAVMSFGVAAWSEGNKPLPFAAFLLGGW